MNLTDEQRAQLRGKIVTQIKALGDVDTEDARRTADAILRDILPLIGSWTVVSWDDEF